MEKLSTKINFCGCLLVQTDGRVASSTLPLVCAAQSSHINYFLKGKNMNVKIEQSWKDALSAEFDKDYFIKLTDFVRGEYLSGKAVYPAPQNIFNAFSSCFGFFCFKLE